MATPPPPAASGGNVLTRKIGPLPGWAWAGLAVGGFLIYRARKASQAASGTTVGTPATSGATYQPTPEPTASLTTPSGFQYSGPLSGLQGLNLGTSAAPTGATAATSAPTPAVATYSGFTAPGAAINAFNAGVPIFGQVAGQYEPVTVGAGGGPFEWASTGAPITPGSTPIFYQNPASSSTGTTG